MMSIKTSFTVLFEDPFWIGVYESEGEDGYSISKVTFGPEPKEIEVYDMVLKRWHQLRVSTFSNEKPQEKKCLNPKRMQRAISKNLSQRTIGTKAQEALKKQYEEGKEMRKKLSRERKEEEKDRKFCLKQEKRKNKHRGH